MTQLEPTKIKQSKESLVYDDNPFMRVLHFPNGHRIIHTGHNPKKIAKYRRRLYRVRPEDRKALKQAISEYKKSLQNG